MKPGLILTFLLLLTMSATAFPASLPGRITHLGIESGLSNGYVVSIAQDGDGFIWLATEDGLNRFDGRRFVNYNRHNSGLTANELNSLAYSPAHPDKLYIATQRAGICVYDRKTGEIHPMQHPKPISEAVTSIVPASDGGIWLSHYHFGVEHFNPDSGKSTIYGFETIKGLPRKVWTMAEGEHGKIYIGHCQEGFSVVDTLTKTFVNYRNIPGQQSLPGNEVYCICIDPSGYVWLGTDAGAAIFNPSTGAFIPFVHNGPGSIGAGKIKSIRHLDGEIWFATSQGGVSILDLKSNAFSDISKAEFISIPVNGSPNGISGVYSQCIFPDSYGNIWIGNYRNGVDVISHVEPIFSRLDYKVGDVGNPVFKPAWGCVKGMNGEKWFGGENEIACISRNGCEVFPLPNGENGNRTFVNAMAIDDYGNVWVGTHECGAFIFKTSSASFHKVNGIPGNVRGLIKAGNGEMWACTSEGIYSSDGSDTSFLGDISSKVYDNVVECAVKDKKGQLWVGTFGQGISVLSPDYNTIRAHLSIADGIPSNAINVIKCDSRNRIWVATRNGVIMFPDIDNPELFKTFPKLEDLGITYVKAVEEAPDSSIWMTTNKGIVRLSNDDNISLYQPSPDLPLDSFTGNGSMTDNDGNILFTSVNGIFLVNPHNACTPPSSHIPLIISNFTTYKEGRDSHDNEYSIPISSKKLSLSYDQNTFKITFCTLDYALTEHYDLSYNMKGLDNVWMETYYDNYAMYRDLPPGKYEFQVRQRQKGHDWMSPETVLYIEIAPPIWMTWWAKLAYAIVIISAIAVAMLYYKKRVDMKQRLEAEMENNRNKQQLNEERLRFYTNVTHELRTPLTLILGPLEDIVSDPGLPSKYSSKLQMIRDSSNTLLNLINGILEFRKTETQNRHLTVKKGNLGNLLREIGLRYTELNRNPDVEICLDIENDKENIYFDPDIITTIVNNLLSNAVKYTPEGIIRLSYHTVMENDIRNSVISVSDTGYGISKEGLSHIFERYYQVSGPHQASGTGIGLALVKSLADIHHATIDVESKENVGSVFTLRLLTDMTYPLALHRDSDIKAQDKTQEPSGQENDSPRAEKNLVLVVEDNDSIREYIRQALSDEFKVITARNGLEGLKAVHTDNPNLVISDIMMPEMDGIDLCRTLKEDIMTSHIPVILLTAKDSIDDKEMGYDAGADSYLTKPFSAKLLLSRIHNLMRRRRLIASTIMDNLKGNTLENHYVHSLTSSSGSGTCAPEITDSCKESIADEVKLSEIDREFIEKFTSIIRDNIAVKDLGVPFLADKMCMSLSALYRKVTSLLGVSTAEYISKVRLSVVAELLLKGDNSVTEIAYMTGFSGHSTLARAFKREYGMTATEYAAQARASKPGSASS